MYQPVVSNGFKREVKKVGRRGKKLAKLYEVMRILASGEQLPTRFRCHKLTGNYRDRLECHIEPDWLLIYQIKGKQIIFERTGSHSDLF